MSKTNLKKLSSTTGYETKKILKKSISASRALANLNGVAKTIPNENIITTHDELYISTIDSKNLTYLDYMLKKDKNEDTV